MGHDKFQKNRILLRREKIRKPRRILIVCEGEKTEPNYFRKFDANQEVYDRIEVHGTGYWPTKIKSNALIQLRLLNYGICFILIIMMPPFHVSNIKTNFLNC